nr:uncharacterized protein LOC129532510 [Gorilla gorilla gorilla]
MVTWQEERSREWGSRGRQSTLGPLARFSQETCTPLTIPPDQRAHSQSLTLPVPSAPPHTPWSLFWAHPTLNLFRGRKTAQLLSVEEAPPGPPWSCPRQQKGLTNPAIPHLQRGHRTAHICLACQLVGNRPSRFTLLLSSQGSLQRRSRQSFPSRGEVWSQLSKPKPPTTHPGRPCPAGPGPRPVPPREPRSSPPWPRAPALTTRPGPAGCARRGGRRPLRARAPRAAASPRVWRSRSCYPETEGRKTAPAARPSRAALPPPGTKETKPRRPGSAPLLPPRLPGCPPPARRPGQAGSSPESRARGPEPPGTPHSSPAGSASAEGWRPDPSRTGEGGGGLHRGGRHGNAGRLEG